MSRFHCECWEIRVQREEVEGILAKLRKQNPSVLIQVFSASPAPNPTAVEMIAAQTLTAAKSGATLAERPELDMLLRLAGTRQIGDAFERVGYKSKGRRLFMVAACEGRGALLTRVASSLSRDRRFSKVPRRKPSVIDLEQVERAALLAVRL